MFQKKRNQAADPGSIFFGLDLRLSVDQLSGQERTFVLQGHNRPINSVSIIMTKELKLYQ